MFVENSKVGGGKEKELLAGYRETILSTESCSPVWAVAKLATIGPEDRLNPKTGERTRLLPKGLARCGPIILPDLEVDGEAIMRCVMINSFNFSLVITLSPRVSDKVGKALARLPGQALDYNGRMRVGPPSLPFHVATHGIQNWPRSESS